VFVRNDDEPQAVPRTCRRGDRHRQARSGHPGAESRLRNSPPHARGRLRRAVGTPVPGAGCELSRKGENTPRAAETEVFVNRCQAVLGRRLAGCDR
jgi:hypothetical protein